MRAREAAVKRLAATIARHLDECGYVRLKAPRLQVAERVAELILDNLRQEQELEEEAERLARRHAAQMHGLDERKIIQGIKERLARERGFQL